MALSIVQHIDSTSTSTAAGGLIPRQAWPSPTLPGNLLIAFLSTATNASTICNTPGWKLAVSVQNGVGLQSEIWYKNYKTGYDQSPTFMTTVSTSWYLALAEVTGFPGYSLDKTGTATGANVNTLVVPSTGSVTDSGEFVIGGLALINTSSGIISFNASTAAGSAVFAADIDNKNADGATDGQGGAIAWATGGASATTPSITFNISRNTLLNVAGTIVTFTSAPAVGFNRNNLRPHPFSPGIAR